MNRKKRMDTPYQSTLLYRKDVKKKDILQKDSVQVY